MSKSSPKETTMSHHSIMTAMPERASNVDLICGIATSLNNSECTQDQIVRYLEKRRPRALASIARA